MSGKVARKLRKSKKISKKSLALCAGVCLFAAPITADGEFLVSVYPHFSKPIGESHDMKFGIGGGLKLTYRPNDFLNLFIQGDYLSMSLPGVDPVSVLNAGVGAGYHLGLSDRLALDFNVDIGAYNAKMESKTSGVSAGATVSLTYKINPVIYTDINASASHFAGNPSPLMMLNAALSPGVTFNISEMFKSSAKVNIKGTNLDPVFPVLYSWYENNSFGTIELKNEEESSITDITVSFYQPQYMAHPKECVVIDSLKKDETREIDLVAFFNEQILELTEKTNTQGFIIVDYSCLGQKRSKTFTMDVPVYGRNNMSWDDDRRAAVFVSSKDPAAMLFAKYVTSIVRDNVRSGVPVNIQYAMGIFEVLDQFGLNYVVDPSSAFEDNVGTSSIDFLQFPYQTLMYRGGDCDDISILVCSLFEAVGIRTAFITIPGHIFMAFDSGLNVRQATEQFTSLNELIVMDNEVWVPLEITLTDEGFNKAWRVGAREWNTAAAQNSAAFYKMSDSWKIYQPISVPGATAYFTMPDNEIIGKLFDHSVDQWIAREIQPQIDMYQAKLAVKDDVKTRNKLGVLYGKYGLFVQADDQFKQARRKGYTPSVINTGNIYYAKQNYELAREWYKSVLKNEPDNELAILGIARCAYELADYDECDDCYSKVMQLNPELAAEYAYLGSFVNSKGRAFSLADRLNYTVWSEEKETVTEEVSKSLLNTNETVIEEDPFSKNALEDILNFAKENVVVVQENRQNEEENDEQPQSNEGGDGDDNKKDVVENNRNDVSEEIDLSSFTENFDGLSTEVFVLPSFSEVETAVSESEVFYNEVKIETETAVSEQEVESFTAEDEIAFEPQPEEFELDDFLGVEEATPGVEVATVAPIAAPGVEIATPAEEIATPGVEIATPAEEIAAPGVEIATPGVEIAAPTAEIAAPTAEIAEIAAPRFTEQPSAEWAPETAYFAETIPGMKSYEEEMGEYQNEKAFLYEDAVELNVDPDHDYDIVVKEDTKIAMSGLPDVDPFSSYLSKEDAKKVASITNYSIEKVKAEENKKIEAKEKTEKSNIASNVISNKSAEVVNTVENVVTNTVADTVTKIADAVTETVTQKNVETVTNEVVNEKTTESAAVSLQNEKIGETKIEKSETSGQNKIPVGGAAGAVAAIVAAGSAGIIISKKSKKRK